MQPAALPIPASRIASAVSFGTARSAGPASTAPRPPPAAPRGRAADLRLRARRKTLRGFRFPGVRKRRQLGSRHRVRVRNERARLSSEAGRRPAQRRMCRRHLRRSQPARWRRFRRRPPCGGRGCVLRVKIRRCGSGGKLGASQDCESGACRTASSPAGPRLPPRLVLHRVQPGERRCVEQRSAALRRVWTRRHVVFRLSELRQRLHHGSQSHGQARRPLRRRVPSGQLALRRRAPAKVQPTRNGWRRPTAPWAAVSRLQAAPAAGQTASPAPSSASAHPSLHPTA